jgi:ubiquitin-protein ligase
VASSWERKVSDHFKELQERFPKSSLKLSADYRAVSGQLRFSAAYEGITISDRYSIQLDIPENYPDKPPTVRETGRRIARDYHTQDDVTLCLETPQTLQAIYSQGKSLLTFVEKLVIPFLFRHSVLKRTGAAPWAERSHGGTGLLENYCELFRTPSKKVALHFLEHLSKRTVDYRKPSPCGGGQSLSTCTHGVTLCILRFQGSFSEFREELQICYDTIPQAADRKTNQDVFEEYLNKREHK